MSTLSARSAATALRLLTKYGQDYTLVRATTAAYDPTTGTAAETTTNYIGKGVSLNDVRGQLADSMIATGDKTVLLSLSGAIPIPSDKLVIDGVNYSVNTVEFINPAGPIIIYQLKVRVGT